MPSRKTPDNEYKDIAHPINIEMREHLQDRILEKYQHLKSETLMIGDASYDLQMARRAGVSNCGVTWGSFSEADLCTEKPDFIVHDFRDLLDLTE